MPPKLDPSEKKISELFVYRFIVVYTYYCCCLVFVRAIGGESGNSATLAPKIGPLGLVSYKHNLTPPYNTLYYLGAKEGWRGHSEENPGVQGSQGNCQTNNPEQTGRS